jgi:peptidoglycan/LPS O-acetylase OafA/YrhL
MANISGAAGKATASKLYGLDHLRTLAIVLVLVFHYAALFPHPAWLEAISKFGWTGVDLFFVLSGYLIASQLFYQIAQQQTISLKTFFLKRFFRIIPAYLVVVGIYFCFPYVHEREALAPLWKYLSFTLNLGLDLRTQGTFSHAWSLCIEEQFYFFLPLILIGLVHFKLLKKGFWLLITLFIAGFAIRYYAYNNFVLPHIEEEYGWANWYRHIYYPTYCRLDGLLAGVGIAALLQFRPAIKERLLQYGNALLLLSIAILTAAYILCIDQESFEATVFGFPLVSIGYGVMVLGAVSPNSFLYKYGAVGTSTIAALSYAFYLTHKFVIHITQDQFVKLGIAKDSNSMLLVCIVTMFIVAMAMRQIIEKPFLKLRDKVLAK